MTAPKLTELMMCNCPGMAACSLSFETNALSKFIYISLEESEIELVPTQLFGLVISARRICVQHQSNAILTSSVIEVTRELFKARYIPFNSWLVQVTIYFLTQWCIICVYSIHLECILVGFQSLSSTRDLARRLAVDVFCNVRKLTISLRSDTANVRTVLLLISRCIFVSMVSLKLEVTKQGSSDVFFLYILMIVMF